MRKSELPVFGVLKGVKVVINGSSAAGPVAGRLMADHGAEVIWMESAKARDGARSGSAAEVERRNMRTICVDIPTPGGREIFKRLLAEADIYIENLKPGIHAKWGFTDEAMWEINPKLVIAHVSGFGQYGDPYYMGRAAYDMMAQSFSGLAAAATMPGDTVLRLTAGQTADYYTAYLTAFACMAGYVNALKTGKGESFDCAQYEAVINTGWSQMYDAMNGKPFNYVPFGYAYGTDGYMCADGNWIYITTGGSGVVKGVIFAIGLGDEYGDGKLYENNLRAVFKNHPGGKKFDETLRSFCASMPAAEAEAKLSAAGAACSVVLKHADMATNPQYVARESLTKMQTKMGYDIVVPNVAPKAKNNPGEIFRPCPCIGDDNEDILRDLGFSEDEINGFNEAKILVKNEMVSGYKP